MQILGARGEEPLVNTLWSGKEIKTNPVFFPDTGLWTFRECYARIKTDISYSDGFHRLAVSPMLSFTISPLTAERVLTEGYLWCREGRQVLWALVAVGCSRGGGSDMLLGPPSLPCIQFAPKWSNSGC